MKTRLAWNFESLISYRLCVDCGWHLSNSNVVYVSRISLNIPDDKSSRLRNFFNQIKAGTSLWQCGKNKDKIVYTLVGYDSPQWSDRYIFSVYKGGFCARIMINQECSSPDPNERVLPRVVKRTMHVNI